MGRFYNNRGNVRKHSHGNKYGQQQKNCCFYAVCAKQMHGTIGCLLLGNKAVNMHP
jgi:hypothetical protein